jgi:hypothetical protein
MIDEETRDTITGLIAGVVLGSAFWLALAFILCGWG